MQQTEHYQLSQWELEDRVLMADFNRDNQKTDAALNTLAGQVAQKANSSTVNSLTTKVNAKADQSALSAEQTARRNADNAEKAAREAADTALSQTHAADVAALRGENCWVKLGEWTLTEDASQIDIDLTGIDWSAFRRLEMEFSVTGESGSTFCLRVNHLESKSYLFGNACDTFYELVNLSNRISAFMTGRISIDVSRNYAPLGGNITYTGYDGFLLAGMPLPFAVPSVQTGQLTSIQLHTFKHATMLHAGSQAALYGLKK